MLRAMLNKSWWQHPIRNQLYGHLPPITKTIQVRRTRHAGHCWRSRDELISDVLLWTPTYGLAKAWRPTRTYIQQLCEDTGCSPQDLPETMNDREGWRERVRDIRASGTWWRWWWWSDGDTNYNWWAQYRHQRIDTGTGGPGNKRTSGDHLNYIIIKIDENTEKCHGVLWRLVLTKTPVRNHPQKLMWKPLKRIRK